MWPTLCRAHSHSIPTILQAVLIIRLSQMRAGRLREAAMLAYACRAKKWKQNQSQTVKSYSAACWRLLRPNVAFLPSPVMPGAIGRGLGEEQRKRGSECVSPSALRLSGKLETRRDEIRCRTLSAKPQDSRPVQAHYIS